MAQSALSPAQHTAEAVSREWEHTASPGWPRAHAPANQNEGTHSGWGGLGGLVKVVSGEWLGCWLCCHGTRLLYGLGGRGLLPRVDVYGVAVTQPSPTHNPPGKRVFWGR